MDKLEETASMSDILDGLAKIEVGADEVLMDRAQIVELDKKRKENRTAECHLKAMLTAGNDRDRKTWVCFGNTFFKFPTKTAHDFLTSNQQEIEKEINRIRDGLKEKVNKREELRGNDPTNRGSFLTALSSKDASCDWPGE